MQTKDPQQDLALLIGAGADPQALAAFLDGLDPEARVREVRALSRKSLAALYERCASPPAAQALLDEFLPQSVKAGQTAIFAGLNNLPMFRTFEKRFTRTQGGAIIGYNHQTMSPFTGPGYFTVTMTAPSASVPPEIFFDYTTIPAPHDAPSGWPKVVPNNRGLSHFIYKGMYDYVRRVSHDVYIGHATRLGKPMPQYFVLARR